MKIKRTAWNTAGVQTDNLREMDAEFCWAVEKVYQENTEGATEPASCSFLFRVNSASFNEKRQEKKEIKIPFSFTISNCDFSGPNFTFNDHE